MNLLHVELEGEQNLSVLFPRFAGKSGDLPELKKGPETRPQFWVSVLPACPETSQLIEKRGLILARAEAGGGKRECFLVNVIQGSKTRYFIGGVWEE